MNGFFKKYQLVLAIAGVAVVALVGFLALKPSAPVVDVQPVEEVEAPVVEVVEPVEPVVVEPETAPEPVVVEEVVKAPEPEVVEEVVEAAPIEEPEAVVEEPVVEEPVVESVVEETVEPEVETEAVEETPVVEAIEPEAVVEEVATKAPVVVEEATVTVVEEVEVEEPAAIVEEVAEVVATPVETKTATEETKPTFDVVRVDPTGAAVIAGSAEPNSTVAILSNGEEIGEAVADSAGDFVAIIQVPDSESGQTLELESETDGQTVLSEETIIILPTLQDSAEEGTAPAVAPAVIMATAEEVVIIQDAEEVELGQVTLDAISYDENDEVVLTGRGNPGRTIIIYVNDLPLVNTLVSTSGKWRQALYGLEAGRYILRVDEIDDEGNVTSRVETPFQREYPEDVQEAKGRLDTSYTVQPGNSLWVIATGRYGDGMRYHQIFAANKDQIRDPNLIYPGQVFALPESE